MTDTQLFAVVVLLAGALIVALALYLRREGEPFVVSPGKIAALGLVVAAILVGRDGWLGYALGGAGILIAIGDTARLRRRTRDLQDPQ